ncbi:MAG: DNA recombination protein RmuC [Kiritimatiellae bacterium]|nr:DNA recombination protein RmuC [Kiritimatiellia bacterium]
MANIVDILASGIAGAAVAGAVVYMWQGRKAEKERENLDRLREEADRARSNIEVAYKAKCEEMSKLEQSATEDLDRQAGQYAAQIADLNVKLDASQKKSDAFQGEIALLRSAQAESKVSLEAEKKRIADMQRHYEEILGQMKNEFKSLSDDVLKEKREQLEKTGLAGVENITEKLRKEIESFRICVETVNKDDIERTTSLKKEIEHLVAQTNLVSSEADKLATAIRADAQVTGQWGEIQLKRVLELGGLQETVDYEYQETFASPGSSRLDLRTDVLVKMPDDRWLVIDAKTTMAAYVDYVGENGERNSEAIGRIVNSLVEHVKEMKKADYHRKLESTTGKRILPVMFMYIPFEEVYLIAMKMQIDSPEGRLPFRDWAWKNEIVLVNSSGLMPIVRMLAELWSRNKSEKKVLKIKEAAEQMVEKFKLFLDGAGNKKDGFLAIGASLKQAVLAYNESLKRLSDGNGSVMKKLHDLKDMGVTGAGAIPPPRQVGELEVKTAPSRVE